MNRISHPAELIIPQIAVNDEKAVEIIRVWIANKGQHFSLRAGTWDDPAAWGLVFADLARGIAQSYKDQKGRDFQTTLDRISLAFKVEIEEPTK